MVEKGLCREDLAIAVLIDFPFEILGGWLAGKWARGDKPLQAWIYCFWPRIALTVIAAMVVFWFPAPPISSTFFAGLVFLTILQSFAGYVVQAVLIRKPAETVMVVALSSSVGCPPSTLAYQILLWAEHT